MNRFFLLALAVLVVLSLPVLSQADLLVGIDKELIGQWESVGENFEQKFTTSVWFQGYSQNSMAQQIVLQSFAKSGRLHFVMVPHSWGPTLSRYLVDLSDLERSLLDRGADVVTINQQPVGVEIPFASDWFLGMLTWPEDPEMALEFLAFVAQGGETAIGSPALPQQTVVSPQATVAIFATQKIARVDHNPLIDGALEALIGAAEAAMSSTASHVATAIPTFARAALDSLATLYGVPFSSTTSMVTVVLESQPGRSASNVAALSRLGINQNAIAATSNLIKVTIPLSALSTLTKQLTGISFIRAPYTPFALGTPSEGTAAIGADGFHAVGIRGSGSKVAIIDLGFSGLAQAQARGDLPYTIGQNDLTGTGLSSGITHGTAVAEIIYDIAPEADLYLIKIADEVDLDLAVTYCLSNGIDIINHSLGWYNTNFYDGTGTIAETAQRAISGGILWVNAAGNEAESHWEGVFTDGNSDGWLDQNVTFYATAGSQAVLFLTWNEWPQASTDYDLYLFDPSSNLVASSTKHQTGTEEPTESIQVSTTASGIYTIRIQGTGSRSLELFNLYQSVSPLIAASSILAPANAANVIAVGALGYSQYTTGPIQPYSSQGPSNSGQSKPDIVAPDNVTTGTSPYTTFPGTSGAAPHVSGAAALLLSQTPGLSEYALRTQLLSQTIPMGGANVYGNGRLSLQAPAGANSAPTASFVYSPTAPTTGATVSFNANSSFDPDGSIVLYEWDFTGNGITDATGVVQARAFAAGTYSIRLTVTDNDGASNTQIRSLTVTSTPNQPPNAAFNVSPSSGQPGTWFTFSASASSDPDGSIVSYVWNFGDGGTDSGITAYNSYAAPGTYTVQLTVTDNDGATDITTRSVSVQAVTAPDLVVQSINYAPTSPVIGQSVTFSITVMNQGNATAGFFRIRLTGTSSSTQSYITQLTPGASQVVSLALPLTSSSETFTATADDLDQINESIETNNTNTVLVAAAAIPLIADAGGPYSGTAGSSIAFNGSGSTGTIYTYLWSFGDGSSSQGVSQSHTYTHPGTYTVTLTVYGSGGQQSIDTTHAVVSASAPALTAQLYLPQATYQVDDTLVITYTVNRTAYVYLCDVTADGHVTLLSPNWLEPSPLATAGTHTFPGSGGYTLRITEPVGTETLYLFAASGPISGFPTSFSYGFPLLSTNPSSFRSAILATMQSQFSSGDWAFDTLSFQVTSPAPTTGIIRVISSPTNALVKIDGAPVGNTTHEQANVIPGIHTVEVSKSGYHSETRQVTVNAGLTSTVSVTLTPISTNSPPVANFNFSPSDPIVGSVVSFDASSSSDPDGSITSYAWNFGDSSTGSGQFVTHAFAASGTYSVTLTVTDNEGAQGTKVRSVTVGTSENVGWVSPVSHEDPAANWKVEERAYDDDVDRNYNTNAQHYSHNAGEWTSYIILNAPSGGLQCDRIRVLLGDSAPGSINLLSWDIDVYRDGAWIDVYTGTEASLSEHDPDDEGHEWVEIAFSQGLVTRMRLRAYNNHTRGSTMSRIYEADFHDATVPTP
ncbi:PKD domain-containing protein [Candidatus Bipolaricaulota bacterium]|nr:PKD domain-containing protein [Candidatus Bipolaricaulota bacterium]